MSLELVSENTKPYTIVDLVQGSDKWIQERKKYITASDIPALLNESPYKTQKQLFDEKLLGIEQDLSSKAALFAKGHAIEESVRNMHNTQGYNFKPKVVVSKKYPSLMASLDGLEQNIMENTGNYDVILEVKYMGKNMYTSPLHHIIQIQAQLLATGARYCVYSRSDGFKHSALKIEPDPFMQERILRGIELFEEKKKNLEAKRTHYYNRELDLFVKIPTVSIINKDSKPFIISDPRLDRIYELKNTLDFIQNQFNYLVKEVTNHYKQYPVLKGSGVVIENGQVTIDEDFNEL